jgi:chorismate dehydratase
MWDFEHGETRARLQEQFDVTYTIPSACAEALRTGMADIGIIPVAAYPTIPGLVILPGVAIASLTAVRSILLVSRKPLGQIKTVALDTSSLTSVALCKILLSKWLGGPREYRLMTPDLEAMLASCDAALLIGDPALLIERTSYATVIDLAEQWRNFTGKPFVFAFWAVREEALAVVGPGPGTPADTVLRLAEIFQRSRDHGLAPGSLRSIASEWGPRLGMSLDTVILYLTVNIHYSLDEACREGLSLFYQHAEECGALPATSLATYSV